MRGKTARVTAGAVLVAGVAALAFAVGCSPAGQSVKALVVGIVADPITLDAHAVGDNNTRRMVYQMFDPLVREDVSSGKVVPALAESWEVSSDGLSYTLKLRKGVKFHDGEPFDAAAVKFNLDRQIDESHPNFKDGNWLFMRAYMGSLKSVDIADQYTVRLTLKQPDVSFLSGMTTNPTYMISPKSIKDFGKEVGTKPVGTGPFRFVSWEKGGRLVLQRNGDYWGEKAKVDQLIFLPIAEAEARLNALRTGQIQFTIDLPPDAVTVVQQDPNLKVESKVSRSFWGLQLNTKFEPFTKVKVRQAVAYAINREQLTKDVLKGTGVPARGIFSDAFGEYVNRETEPYGHNVDRAKQLLKEAGYPNGFESNFLIPISGSGMQQPRPMAEYIQANLARIGIKANLEALEWAAYVAKWRNGEFGMSARGITPVVIDPSSFLNLFFTCKFRVPKGNNAQSTCEPEYDKVAESINGLLNPQERLRQIHKAQDMLQRMVPWVFVDHELDLYFMSKKVKGFEIRGNYLIDANKIALE